MSGLALHSNSLNNSQPDLATQILDTTNQLTERKVELTKLQDEFREFKTLYARIVGGKLAELEEVERELRAAEAKAFGLADGGDQAEKPTLTETVVAKPSSLKKLFWSVARMFHPDHASDEQEAQRRHTVMSQATRAYTEGDIESLETLLGDDELRFFCASGPKTESTLADQLWALKDELRTIEFGIKRIIQDPLYATMLTVAVNLANGQDPLKAMAETLTRKIAKTRFRLEHLV